MSSSTLLHFTLIVVVERIVDDADCTVPPRVGGGAFIRVNDTLIGNIGVSVLASRAL